MKIHASLKVIDIVAGGPGSGRHKGNEPDLQKLIDKASQLGDAAHKAGKKAVPAHDPEVLKLLKGLPVGKGGSKILDAWLRSWHKSNLSAAGLTPKTIGTCEVHMGQHKKQKNCRMWKSIAPPTVR